MAHRNSIDSIGIAGAALYWGITMRNLMGWYRGVYNESFLQLTDDFWMAAAQCIPSFCSSLLIGVILIAMVKVPGKKLARWLSMFAATLYLVMTVLGLLDESPLVPVPLHEIRVFLRGAGFGTAMVLWSWWFASLDKNNAGRSVVHVAILGIFLCALSFIVRPAYSVVFDSICLALSMVCFLKSSFNPPRIPRDFNRAALPSITLFYVSRLVIGFCLGFSSILLSNQTNRMFSPVLLIFIMFVTAMCLFYFWRSRSDPLRMIPLIPLLAMGCISLLDAHERGTIHLEESVTCLTWFCWIAMSSFQLSELKETYGMRGSVLSASEKLAIMVSWGIGVIAAQWYQASGPLPRGVDFLGYFTIFLVYGMVFFSTATIWNLAYQRKKVQIIEEATRPERERASLVYDRLAVTYGLSAREREVLAMLADGHTRRYVQDALCISDGTAKAHVAHLYRKLGVHKKEELLALVAKAKETDSA